MVLAGSLRPYTADDNGAYKPLIEMDCRGCEPTTFVPLSDFTCRNVDSNQPFTEVDFSEENEWADYDEKSGQTVGVYEFQYQFNTYAKK